MGTSNRKSLQLIAAGGAQDLGLSDGLDAFGGDDQPQRPAQGNDRADDRAGVGRVLQIGDEAAVHLDLVDRELAEVAEGGIAGAEIVERNAEPGIAQPAQIVVRSRARIEQDLLGDFEFDRPGIGPRIAKNRDQLFHEVALAKLNGRQVHGGEPRA